MARRTRFRQSLLILGIFASQALLAQEAPGKKPAESDASEQATSERNARFSRTHCDVPSCVQKVLHLSNISQPVDMQDVVNVIRAIADIQRVQQLIGIQTIIIEGTAEQVALGESLAAEIDKDKRGFGGLGYRIDVRIQESEGDKKLRSRLYSFVSAAHHSARVTMGRPGPPKAQSEPASENKQPPDSGNARSIECNILTENERTLELNVEIGFASDTTQEAEAAPLIRSRVHLTVELDKPTIISRIDDPDSDRSFTIELTATRIKERT